MSKSLNRIEILGNVGRDPDVQTTASGTKVAHFSVATSWGSGEKEKTDWHRVTCWDKLADIAERYVRKGERIYIAGRMEYGTYDKNGVEIPTAEIIARDLILLGSPSGPRTTTESDSSEGSHPGDVDPSPYDDPANPLPF